MHKYCISSVEVSLSRLFHSSRSGRSESIQFASNVQLTHVTSHAQGDTGTQPHRPKQFTIHSDSLQPHANDYAHHRKPELTSMKNEPSPVAAIDMIANDDTQTVCRSPIVSMKSDRSRCSTRHTGNKYARQLLRKCDADDGVTAKIVLSQPIRMPTNFVNRYGVLYYTQLSAYHLAHAINSRSSATYECNDSDV